MAGASLQTSRFLDSQPLRAEPVFSNIATDCHAEGSGPQASVSLPPQGLYGGWGGRIWEVEGSTPHPHHATHHTWKMLT